MHIYKMWKHKSWGDLIEWDKNPNPTLPNFGPYKLHGWLDRIPQVGDQLLVFLSHSTTISVFTFEKVERYRDPSDMFKAEVVWTENREPTEKELKAEEFSQKLYSPLKEEGYYEPFKGFVRHSRTQFSTL